MPKPFDQSADPSMFAELAQPQQPEALPEEKEFPQVRSTAPGDDQTGEYASRVRGKIDDAREFNAEVSRRWRGHSVLPGAGAVSR
jgi:hypothetical protein